LSTQVSSSALILPANRFPLIERIKARREAVEDPRSWNAVGKMVELNFEPDGMHRPIVTDHLVVYPNAFKWRKETGAIDARTRRPMDFPRLVMTNDEQELMIVMPIPPLPGVQGPDFDDPSTWVPTDLPGWQAMRGGDPRTVGHMPRRYEQHYGDLTDDYIGQARSDGGPDFRDPDTFDIIQPVHQILVHPVGSNNFNVIVPRKGLDGTHMAFLVNPLTGEGHFIGGRVYITTRVHTIPAGSKP
jgi:hypothetical protein